MACTYEYKGNWYTQEQLKALPEFSKEEFYSPMSFSSVPASPYKKLVDFKGELSVILNKKLNSINSKLSGDTTVAERRELLRQKDIIKYRLDGDYKKGVKGLEQEIVELFTGVLTKPLEFYAEQDLNRLEVLTNSNHPTDIREAEKIIDFYYRAGTFERGVENPFFTEAEIFGTGSDIKIDPVVVAQHTKWKETATTHQNTVVARGREAVENMMNSNPSVVKQYGVQSYPSIVSAEGGYKDVDWVSMWLLDPTQSLSGTASPFAQVMQTTLVNSIEEKQRWARGVAEKLDGMHGAVEKELSKLGYNLSGGGIMGLKGVSYGLFMQKYKSGKESGKLISQFTEDFNEMSRYLVNKFFSDISKTASVQDFGIRRDMIEEAHNTLKRHRRVNSIVLELGKLPEISSDPEFSKFSSMFEDDGGTHKSNMIKLLGQKEYNNHIKEQKKFLRNYIAKRENLLESTISVNGVSRYEDLPEREKYVFNLKDASMNPFVAVKDYYSAPGLKMDAENINNHGEFNVYVARKYKMIPTVQGDQLVFTDTNTETGFYNKDFEIVQNNKVLSDFHDLASESLETIRTSMPPDIQRKMAAGSVPSHMKNMVEIMLDSNNDKLSKVSKAFRKMMDDFKQSWGVMKEGHISVATIDSKTGKPNYEVNSSFLKGNTGAIDDRMTIEESKFLQVYNQGAQYADRITNLTNTTVIPITKMKQDSILQVAQYVGVELTPTELAKKDYTRVTNITGPKILIKKIMREAVTHTVVQSQSFDLFKLLKLYSNLSMAYAAREESLPLLEIAKKHYEAIKAPMLNNTQQQKKNRFTGEYETVGTRTNAISQFDDWFGRVPLNNYEQDKTKRLFGNTTIYSDQEKELRKEIDEVLENEGNPERKKRLQDIKDKMGKIVTSGSLVDRLLKHVRFLGLGWNIPSSMINNAEGFISNMIQASSNEFYDGRHIYYAYKVTRWSRLKGLTLGKYETGIAHKNSTLMARFNVLMDSKNELQKSSVKTNFSALEKLNPYYINSSVEFLNQSPVMISMLKTIQIKDSKGNELSVWDAMDNNGNLIGDFRTKENVENWEELSGEEYLNFKNKIGEAITKAHGNYDDLRGMKAKSTLMGKIILTFKTWMTSQIHSRFAEPQFNVKSGSVQKGRLKSLTGTTGASYGAIVGGITFGLPGVLIGAGLGSLAGSSTYGVAADISILNQLRETTLQLFRRMIGMPINIITGKQAISTNSGFSTWRNNTSFNEVDLKNMRANITEMALILNTFLMYLMVKGLLGGDDDDDKEGGAHNFLVNKLTQLMGQATLYVRPNTFYKDMVGDAGLIRWLTDIATTTEALGKYFNGDDILLTGPDAGKSKLFKSAKKPFLPSILRDPFSLGFKGSSERVFEDNPVGEYFKSSAQQEKEAINRDRAALRRQLKDNEYTDKQIRELVDKKYPTQSKLKKMEMTRDEYEEKFGSGYEIPPLDEMDDE